jgi:hypothetical protein
MSDARYSNKLIYKHNTVVVTTVDLVVAGIVSLFVHD